MAHSGDDGAERQVALGHVDFVDQLGLATALALDAQEPRREGPERPRQGLLGGGQGIVAVGAPWWALARCSLWLCSPATNTTGRPPGDSS
jgi:hypothetical protein